MEVILKQDISGLGYKNDIVKVRPGYGRNYLIPNGFALIANESNRRLITENVRQMAHKAAKLKQDAEALAAKVGDFVAEIKTKAGESGKIFGAVTALQISDALKADGATVLHIMDAGKVVEHPYTAPARVENGALRYHDGPEPPV